MLMIALGIFFVGIAALAKFYAYPTLAVAPADQVAHTVSEGPDATIFSVADLAEKQGVTLEARRTVRGDAKAAAGVLRRRPIDRKFPDVRLHADQARCHHAGRHVHVGLHVGHVTEGELAVA